MSEDQIIRKLRQNLDVRCIIETSVPRLRRIFIQLNKGCLKSAILSLKDEGFTHLSAITGLEVNDETELLYHLNNEGIELTIRVELPPNEMSIPTITDIIPGASIYEREVHDLFGVKFAGHPDLRRLLLPDEWPEEVHPLRKHQPTKNTREEQEKRQEE